jgi:hypothetical protein
VKTGGVLEIFQKRGVGQAQLPVDVAVAHVERFGEYHGRVSFGDVIQGQCITK